MRGAGKTPTRQKENNTMPTPDEPLESLAHNSPPHTKVFPLSMVPEAKAKHGYYNIDEFREKFGDEVFKKAIAAGDTEPNPALTSVPEARPYRKGDQPGTDADAKSLAFMQGLDTRISVLEETDEEGHRRIASVHTSLEQVQAENAALATATRELELLALNLLERLRALEKKAKVTPSADWNPSFEADPPSGDKTETPDG